MKTQEEIREKIKTLIGVVVEISNRNDALEKKIQTETSTSELEDLDAQFDTIQNQLLELSGNIWAFRWVLGEIDDLQFSIETGSSLIEGKL
jgi:predicted  nucleic acid-binding Zn-ribbon protein